jgi:hypothetical protein
MAMALMLLAGLCGIVSIVCWIIVVVKMFGQSVLTGILGIICGLYALYWGFQNKDAAGLGAVMMVWAIAILANIGINIATMSMAAATGTPVTP